MTTTPPQRDELLKKVRSGLPWLIKAHEAWLADQATQTQTEAFTRILDECATMEAALRAGGYLGCIFGDGPCPENAIITCDACMTPVTEVL